MLLLIGVLLVLLDWIVQMAAIPSWNKLPSVLGDAGLGYAPHAVAITDPFFIELLIIVVIVPIAVYILLRMQRFNSIETAGPLMMAIGGVGNLVHVVVVGSVINWIVIYPADMVWTLSDLITIMGIIWLFGTVGYAAIKAISIPHTHLGASILDKS